MDQFFCTAGRGTEQFVENELQEKAIARKVTQTEGKIFFLCDNWNPEQLLGMKSVERLFIQVICKPDFKIYGKQGLDFLRNTVDMIESSCWQKCFELRQRFIDSLHLSTDSGTKCEAPLSTMELASLSDDSAIPPSKKRKLNKTPSHTNVTFRVSCKCTSKVKRHASVKDMAQTIGVMLSRKLGWNVDLHNPQLEVMVQINHINGLIIGVPVTRQPLSVRPYLHTIGLRSTVAWIMGHLANIQPGQRVLDPMCGAGTILVEAAKSWPGAMYTGSDIDGDQLAKANTNVLLAVETTRIQLLQADVTELPFPDQAIDRVACDAPFGMSYSDKETVKKLYPQMLRGMDRVLKVGGRAVILTSAHLKGYLIEQARSMCGHCSCLCSSTQTNTVCNECETNAQNTVGPKHKSETDSAKVITDKEAVSDFEVEPLIELQTISKDVGSHKESDTGAAITDIEVTSRTESDTYSTKAVTRTQVGCSVPACTQWISKVVHYLQLGETHSHVCVFDKVLLHH